MGVMWSQDSEYARERRKWETQVTQFGEPGRSPAMHTEWPLMIYRAKRPPQGGKDPIIEHVIVDDELQERNMRSRGYVRGPDHAVTMLEAEEREVARAAAERAYTDQRMSGKAQAEAVAVDETTVSHLGTIPETPIRKRQVRR